MMSAFRMLTWLLTLGPLAGCSVNDRGLVHVQTHDTNTNRIRHIQATGVHVETRGPFAGLTVGRLEITQLFAKICGELHPSLRHRRIEGANLTLSSDEFGATIGYQEALWAQPVAKDATTFVQFSPGHPMQSVLQVRGPATHCQPPSRKK